MSSRNGNRPGEGAAYSVGERFDATEHNATPPPAQSSFQATTRPPLHAELIGSRRCSAVGITATGNAPVLTLCRRLIEAGHNPAAPLEARRGSTLCLRVRSIGEGARLTVREGASNGRPRFVRLTGNMANLEGGGIVDVGPPVAPNDTLADIADALQKRPAQDPRCVRAGAWTGGQQL
jgi:hypothetical protein